VLVYKITLNVVAYLGLGFYLYNRLMGFDHLQPGIISMLLHAAAKDQVEVGTIADSIAL